MLKKILPLVLAAPLALALTGCTDPISARQDPIVQYPQVHVSTYLLQNEIRLEAPVVHRVGAGQLKVQIPVRNLTDGDLTVDFIYYFMNNGVNSGEPTSSRMSVHLQRKGMDQIDFTSLNAADDFRVEILDAR